MRRAKAGELSVWAPRASRVEVEVEGARRELRAGARGYFHLEGPALTPGARYRLRLDGGEPRPDPRSQFQPEGVHGPSQVIDHDAFAWTDARFVPTPLERAVIYELHVGTFSEQGTFLGTIERLDHLVRLGVTHVELMPVVQFPGQRGWGYDGVDLFAPHHAYGSPDDLKRLVDACHARGLAVLLDVVYNHLGPDGNYLGEFGPYFTSEYHTPWGAAVNFDAAGSDEVRRFFCDNALQWLDQYHFDGLRLDAVHAIIDRSAFSFLSQLSLEVSELSRALRRPKVLIAESDLNDPRVIRSREQEGQGIDAQWSDDFHHAVHALLTGERTGYYADFGRLEDVARALGEGFVYGGRYSAFRDRRHGRELGGLPLSRLLGYVQTHDQVGNRALGDRIGRTLSAPQLELAAALVLTSPFIPMIFQGEEWNASSPFSYFTDHQDPGLADAVREGRRREFAAFGWAPEEIPDPQAPATFTASKLRWSELDTEEHARLFEWYRALIRLRASRPELTAGERPEVLVDSGGQWLRTRRGSVIVCVNVSAEATRVPVPDQCRVLMGTRGAALAGREMALPAWGVGILERLD